MKSGYYRDIRLEKKDKTFLCFVAKAKIRFSFRSCKYIKKVR